MKFQVYRQLYYKKNENIILYPSNPNPYYYILNTKWLPFSFINFSTILIFLGFDNTSNYQVNTE